MGLGKKTDGDWIYGPQGALLWVPRVRPTADGDASASAVAPGPGELEEALDRIQQLERELDRKENLLRESKETVRTR